MWSSAYLSSFEFFLKSDVVLEAPIDRDVRDDRALQFLVDDRMTA
jgi:hypothetical protein